MKIKNILITLTIVAMSFTSCDKWFDISPSTNIKDKDLFKTEQGFKDILTGVYQLMSSTKLYGKDMTYGYNDVRAQYWRITSTTHNYYYAINYNYSDASEVNRANGIWSTMYKAITNLNTLLSNIDDNRLILTDGNYHLYKGEAIALRAMLHFDILRMFSPTPADGLDQKAIPYYNKETNVAQPQLTIGEVVTSIRKDINSAKELMVDVDIYGPNYDKYSSEEVVNAHRIIKMNYFAATALLARVELYAGNNVAALIAAKEIITLPSDLNKVPFILNTTSSTGDKLFNSENLFILDVPKLKDYTETTLMQTGADATSITNISMTIANKNNLYALASPSDLEYRKSLWMVDCNATQSTLLKYYEGSIIPMIKLSEMYYIAAECETNPSLAWAYLNKIRAARGLSPLAESGNLTKEIETEYKREFIGEGQLFFYYKRKAAVRVGLNNKAVNKSVYALPIPNNEIEFGKIE